MALIKCPECNKELSDKAKTCPHCGCNVKRAERAKAASNATPEQSAIGCLIMAIVILIIFFLVGQGADGESAYTFDMWVKDGMPSGE